MNITDLIVELLQQGQKVELPEIGTFESVEQSPRHDPDARIYYPATRNIVFRSITTGDDSVVKEIARRECVSEDVARQMWSNYIDALSEKIKRSGEHRFGELGTLSLNGGTFTFTMTEGLVLDAGNANEIPLEEVKTYDHSDSDDPFAQFEDEPEVTEVQKVEPAPAPEPEPAPAPEPEPTPAPEPEPVDNSNLPDNVKTTVAGNKVIVETDKDIVFYVWAWNDTEALGQLTEAGWPGDKLTLTSSNDGKFTYEYDFTAAPAIPESFIISTDNDVKFFDGVQFTDGASYDWNKSDKPEPEPVDPELLKNLTFTFKTDTEGDYYVWAWGGDFGGDAFTESGSWPGDKLELKSSENGKYIYGYSFTKTPGILPTNIIISTDGGDTKIYDGVEFENGKEY